MMETQILAVMGSPASGKTMTSLKIATLLSKAKKNVIIVHLEPTCPVIPYILSGEIPHDVSLGELLTKMQLSQDEILGALTPVPNKEYISVLGYKLGESISSYPKIVPSKVVDFFVMLRGLADYIIVDCSTVIEADVSTIIALQFADEVLKLGTSDLKGISYFYTADRLLADSKFKKEKNVFAISNLKEGQEWENVAQQYGGVQYVLPYCKELEEQVNELRVFEKLTEEKSSSYNFELAKLVNGIFRVDLPELATKKKEKAHTKATKERRSLRMPFSKNKGEF
ncbi:MAG: ParA family protein [Lachnospiraceae bacterium]